MNTVKKYYTHRKECWTLHGRLEKMQGRQQRPNNIKKPQEHTTTLVNRKKKHNEDSDFSFRSSEEKEEEVSRTKTLRPAREYKVTQIHRNSLANTGLDLDN